MNLKPLVDFLQAMGHGSAGVDLFRHSMPMEVKAGVLVLSHTPISIDPYTAVRKGTFQVVVRGTNHDSIRDKATAISLDLTAQGLAIGSVIFRYVRPIHEPMIYPRSEGNLLEASVNFEFMYV